MAEDLYINDELLELVAGDGSDMTEGQHSDDTVLSVNAEDNSLLDSVDINQTAMFNSSFTTEEQRIVNEFLSDKSGVTVSDDSMSTLIEQDADLFVWANQDSQGVNIKSTNIVQLDDTQFDWDGDSVVNFDTSIINAFATSLLQADDFTFYNPGENSIGNDISGFIADPGSSALTNPASDIDYVLDEGIDLVGLDLIDLSSANSVIDSGLIADSALLFDSTNQTLNLPTMNDSLIKEIQEIDLISSDTNTSTIDIDELVAMTGSDEMLFTDVNDIPGLAGVNNNANNWTDDELAYNNVAAHHYSNGTDFYVDVVSTVNVIL